MIDGPTAGSFVLAITLIGFAIWLQLNEDQIKSDQRKKGHSVKDQSKSLGATQSDIDRDYLMARSISRKRTNRLIGISGLMILSTAFVDHPIAWMSIWILVMMVLLLVIALAGKDAVRTYRYHQKKLDEVRRMV